jgi:hypothetical protein
MNPSTAPAPGARVTQAGRGTVAARSSRKFHVFRVRVSTGDAAGAGTDSKVFLTLLGTAGHSAEMELLDSLAGDDKFERGNTDEFAVRISNEVGDITRIVLRSDASSLGSDWLVSRVVITNCQNNNQYMFDCQDCWIRDTMPHEFICSERIKRDLQLENVSDDSGLLLSARLPISGAQRVAQHRARLTALSLRAQVRRRRKGRAVGRERVRTISQFSQFPGEFAECRRVIRRCFRYSLDDLTRVVLVDYVGACTALGAVSMYTEFALKLHCSQVDVRPIYWRSSSRLRGAIIILPDVSAAQALVQYCDAQWTATSAMSNSSHFESYIDMIEPIQDNPIAIYNLLGSFRARGDIVAMVGCLWALGAKATRAHYLQALKACADVAQGRTAINLLSDQLRLKLRVDADAYNTVMHSLRSEGVCHALGVYGLMTASGVSINEHTLRILFSILDYAGEWEHSLNILKRAEGLTFDGSRVYFCAVRWLLTRAAEEMFTSVIAVCERGKATSAVIALLDQMRIFELKVDGKILIATLHCCMYVRAVSLL